MTDPDLIQSLRVVYDQVTTLSLATVDEHNLPHAANLYFCADHQLDLYFVSDPKTAHARHVLHQPQVAVTIYPQVRMWQQIRGVQLKGECHPTDPNDWDAIWQTFLGKFPYMADVEQMIRDHQFYRIHPSWVRWIDNSVRFGFKRESTWPPPGFPLPA